MANINSDQQDLRSSPRLLTVTLVAAIVVSVLVGGYVIFNSLQVNEVAELPAPETQSIARRVGVTAKDVEQTWSSWFSKRGLTPPDPANIEIYSGQGQSPCKGATKASGMYYCALDNTAAFDVTFLHALEYEMLHKGELGTALVVARVIAEHIQKSLNKKRHVSELTADEKHRRVLQADCLAGVWAGMAVDRLGNVPDGFYGTVIKSGYEIQSHRSAIQSQDIGLFADGSEASRERAFRMGYIALRPDVCPDPDSAS